MALTPNQNLHDFMTRYAPVCVLTGAGLSVASGLGTYRNDDGQWTRQQPISGQDFRTKVEARKRYWARSYVGWPSVENAKPNRAHYALVKLEKSGLLTALVTQNVDGLHTLAGQHKTIDLHGNLHRVICLNCGQRLQRKRMQSMLLEYNPILGNLRGVDAPDGDSDVDWSKSGTQSHQKFPPDDDAIDSTILSRLIIPPCPHCDGMLKPDVVFFGENVERKIVDSCFESLERAGALLIAGSSLMVYSGYRFAKRAAEINLPIAIINRGITRADSLATLRLHTDCGDALQFATE